MPPEAGTHTRDPREHGPGNVSQKHSRGKPPERWAWGVVWIALAFPLLGAAGEPAGTREGRIREAAVRLERVATPLGEAAAVARLASAFRVPPQAVAELRDQKLDLGEIAVVLALAEAGRASPDAILALWANGRLNWGEIADRLKVDLRTLLRRLDTVRRDLGRSTR